MSSTVAKPPIDHAAPPPIDPGQGGDGGGGDDGPGGRWITVATFLHPAQAHIARLRLEAAGVACVLLDEMTAATNCLSLAVGGVKLQVRSSDAGRAADLLTSLLPPRPRPAVAAFYQREVATMAACVVEATGSKVDVVAEADAWLLRTEARAVAARSLADSPFAGGLTGDGFDALAMQVCPGCGESRSRPTWRDRPQPPNWPGVAPLRGRLAGLLARRRCRACGRKW